MVKKIFITGATGFIGKELVKKISNRKYETKCLVRKNSNIDNILNFKLNPVFGDLNDKDLLINQLKGTDTVLHLATSHLSGNEKVNLITSKNLIEACKKNKVKKIIFISSMAANRTHLDNYGKNKLDIEKLVKESGIDYIILRPSVVYSNNNLSLIGTSIKSIPFIIPIIGNGKYKMNPVHVSDLVDAILAAIDTSQKNKTYDVCGGENISFNEIIRICKKRYNLHKLNLHVPIIFVSMIIKIVPIISKEALNGINENTNANITMLTRDLKIKPINFREAISNVNL